VKAASILVVDSDVLVRTPLAEYLRECGYRVFEAGDASEAEVLLNDETRQIDIVLADVDTGDESGFALARWIRDSFPAMRVVLAGTILASVEKAGDICRDGPALSKPYDHRHVLDRIQRLLAASKDSGTA
jgi:DNA-binding response OmpR family regulator